MGYTICYAGCPMLWASKMKTEIALSTEVEYIALLQSMREVLPLMPLIEEVHKRGIETSAKPCKAHYKIFEDTDRAIETAKVLKMRPRINIAISEKK
jgi:hypothetical protein